MADFLFELGVEEIPVAEISGIAQQLKNQFLSRIEAQNLAFKAMETGVTNRRFMIHIAGLDEKAPDKEEQILGPPKNIAFDKKGKPTMAMKKFLESSKAEESSIIEIETKKGIYSGIVKKTEGRNTLDILSEIIPNILQSLQLSSTMVWNESRTPFIRPIKNILALFNNQLIDCQFAGIQTSNSINGHNLLSAEPLEIHSFKDYIVQLNKNFVMVKGDERKEKILNEIKDIVEELELKIELDPELLDYYMYNNEYPVVFLGKFNDKYLELPPEIIATFMIKEKKLHPVVNRENKLQNLFIGISNIPDENKYVVQGNERVIQATLEDAKFFWDQDKKDDFFSLREKLKNVVFQKDLGTFFEKTERLHDLIPYLISATKSTHLEKSLKQAALHCKNDLVTRMVREFPSLQGIMGGIYSREKQTQEHIWRSIYGHYQPKGFSEEYLEHLGAAILSIADKMDNICGFIHKGIKTSSSKDPYGIRRDANAILKIMIDFQMNFDLNALIQHTVEKFCEYFSLKNNGDALIQKVKDFFESRVENIFKDVLHMSPDLIKAIQTDDSLFIYSLYLRARDVAAIKKTESIAHLIALQKRLKNIIKDSESHDVDEGLLMEKEEKILFEILKESKPKIEGSISRRQYIPASSTLLEMKPVIDNFFEKILVMADDEKIRNNRIALLQRINELLIKIADFSLIVE